MYKGIYTHNYRKGVRKSMKKFLLVFLFAAGLALFTPKSASAHEVDASSTLRHAYKPVVIEKTQTMRARVDNFSHQPVSRLVCVEAFNKANNVKTHLGCLTVNLNGFNSTVGDWAFEFDAPTYLLTPGSYNVVYTYQGTDGSWHRVKSVSMQILDGTFVAR